MLGKRRRTRRPTDLVSAQEHFSLSRKKTQQAEMLPHGLTALELSS